MMFRLKCMVLHDFGTEECLAVDDEEQEGAGVLTVVMAAGEVRRAV